MRTKGITRPYVLAELKFVIRTPSGELFDTIIANDVGVTVEFDCIDADDGLQAYIRSVKSAGAALEGDDLTTNIWMGRDLLAGLPQPDIDAIAEAMVEHMASVIKDENDASLVHANT